MDTYLSSHKTIFFSHLTSFYPFFSHTCLHYSLRRGQFNYSIIILFTIFTMPGTFVRQTFLYFIINFIFLTLQILFTIMDIAHCYFTFDQQKQHLYKYFFLNKKSKHTSFLHLSLTTTVLKTYLHLFDNKSFQDALMSISSPDCIL